MFLRMRGHASRINDYFANAVGAWLYEDDEVAREAALAAAKTAASIQRETMVRYLKTLSDDLLKIGEGVRGLQLLGLAEEIVQKDWGVRDSIDARRALADQNKDYADALDRADPNVFVKKYPDLFA